MFISLADQGSANGYGGIENVLTGSGNDRIEGSPAANRLDGAGGDDVLTGGGGADTLIGADGDDTLQASDGAVDSVNCGPGLDTATADTTDTLQGCASVTYTDNDRDGYSPPADCNDASAVINPSAFDAPANGVDENCDGQDAEVLDRDGDGFARPADCDDADAAVRPSALDRPGNGVDEDCNGRDAAYPRITSGVANSWRASARITRVVRLTVTEAPVGALVALRCSGHGCPRGVKRVRSSGARELRLASFFRGHLLRPGATVEIRITLPDTIGKLVRYRIRRGDVPKPTVLCVPPGASAPQSCIAIG